MCTGGLKKAFGVCMRRAYHFEFERWQKDAGIAIGPILFIIAILAILAAAIAAGSGSFSAPTATEGAKTKASAVIQLGDTLKMGMDRLTMENGISWGGWTINTANTVNNNDLFSPTGGGVSPPSTSMAGNPAVDHMVLPDRRHPRPWHNLSRTACRTQRSQRCVR